MAPVVPQPETDPQKANERRAGVLELTEKVDQLIGLQKIQNDLQQQQGDTLEWLADEFEDQRDIVTAHIERTEPALLLYENTKAGITTADNALGWLGKRVGVLAWIAGGIGAAFIGIKHGGAEMVASVKTWLR